MKYLNPKLGDYSLILIFIAFIGLSIASCGGSGGTDTNPPPEENPPPTATFDSGTIADGETFSYTFDTEGTFEYFCEIHVPQDMQGKVQVSSDATNSGEVTVVMEGLAFNPSSITITPGTTVIWENQDGVTHDLKSGNPSNDGNGDPY